MELQGRMKQQFIKLLPTGAIAFALSYATHESIFWGIINGFFGALYIVYWLFSYTNFNEWMQQFIVYI